MQCNHSACTKYKLLAQFTIGNVISTIFLKIQWTLWSVIKEYTYALLTKIKLSYIIIHTFYLNIIFKAVPVCLHVIHYSHYTLVSEYVIFHWCKSRRLLSKWTLFFPRSIVVLHLFSPDLNSLKIVPTDILKCLPEHRKQSAHSQFKRISVF